MKVEILQENLKSVLGTVSRFVSQRSQLPILANILIKASANKISLSATNLEMSISTLLGAKVSEEGEITVPARTFTDFISNLNPGPLTISTDKENVLLKNKSSQATILGSNSGDYPNIPSSLDSKYIEIDAGVFKKALAKVLFSVSTDETRPVLTGVLFEFGEDENTVVTTDGFRLSRQLLEIRKGKNFGQSVVVPRGVLSEVQRFDFGSNLLKLAIDKKNNQVLMSSADTVFSTRVIQGDFPDYKRIIPKDGGVVVNVGRDDFFQAVKSASVFSRDSNNVVKLTVGEKQLVLSSEGSGTGRQTSSIDAKISNAKEDLEIIFNCRFVEDFLSVCEGESVEVVLISPQSPGVFRDGGDKKYLHLIMPVRMGE